MLERLAGLSQNAFFLERTNSLSAEDHRYFLAINHEGFLLKVGLEDAFGATQRKADIVAKLFAFSGKFTSCCHNFLLPLIFYLICTILPFLIFFVKVKLTLLVLYVILAMMKML